MQLFEVQRLSKFKVSLNPLVSSTAAVMRLWQQQPPYIVSCMPRKYCFNIWTISVLFLMVYNYRQIGYLYKNVLLQHVYFIINVERESITEFKAVFRKPCVVIMIGYHFFQHCTAPLRTFGKFWGISLKSSDTKYWLTWFSKSVNPHHHHYIREQTRRSL